MELQIVRAWEKEKEKVRVSLDALRQLDVIRLVDQVASTSIKIIDPGIIPQLEEIVGAQRCADLGIHWAAVINLAMSTTLLNVESTGADEFIVVVDAGALLNDDPRADLLAASYFRSPVDVHVPLCQVLGFNPSALLKRTPALRDFKHVYLVHQGQEDYGPRHGVGVLDTIGQQYTNKYHQLLQLLCERGPCHTASDLLMWMFTVGVRLDRLSGTNLLTSTDYCVDLALATPDALHEVRTAIKALLFGVLYPCGVCRSAEEGSNYDIEVDPTAFACALDVLCTSLEAHAPFDW